MNEIDAKYVCRLCLTGSLQPTDFLDVSDSSLHQLISQYFYIQISIDDNDKNIPHKVCQSCSKLILDFHAFQKQVFLNQERLIDVPDDSDTDVIEEIPVSVNLENLVKELEIENELIEIDTNTLADKEMSGFAVTPQNNVVKRVDLVERPKYACHICGRQSLNAEEHEIHQFYHQLPEKRHKTFTCEICSKSYEKRFEYIIHLKRHTLDPQVCDICDKEFENQMKLDDHLKLCHVPLIFISCEICGQIFKTRKLMNLHFYLKHREKQEIKCKICNIRLSHHRGLERHNRTVHNPNVKKYKCKYCDKKLMSRRALDVHEARHLEIETQRLHEQQMNEIESDSVKNVEYFDENQQEENFVMYQEMKNGQMIQISLL